MGTLVALAKLWIPRRIIVGFRFPWVLQIQGTAVNGFPKKKSTIFYNILQCLRSELQIMLSWYSHRIADSSILPAVTHDQSHDWLWSVLSAGSVEHVLQFPDVWCIEKQGSCQCLLFKWDPKIATSRCREKSDKILEWWVPYFHTNPYVQSSPGFEIWPSITSHRRGHSIIDHNPNKTHCFQSGQSPHISYDS